GRRSLELPIHRLLQVLDLILKERQTSRALPRLHPNAGLVGIDLTVSVRPHPAARPVAKILRAAHRTTPAGLIQNALTAHPAPPDRLLERLFDCAAEPLGNRHRSAL